MNYLKTYNEWLNSDFIDDETRTELETIKNDEKEIEDRFYKELAFGTGGLRGIIGAGTNRINKYIVRKAAQGLANYIISEKICGEGVAIAYDSRYKSKEFAVETGKVLAANGIKAYIFDELRPTPELSFAVRYLNASAGVVITASHNPPKYNGFKVYGHDGAQLSIEPANKLLEYINSLDIFKDVKIQEEKTLIEQGLIEYIGDEIDAKYLANVKKQCIAPEVIKKVSDEFKIIYTPLHGTGRKPVKEIFNMIGIKNVISVKEQEQPDSDFPTVKTPNPEEKEAFNLAVEIAKKENVELIIATDPDCDRVGVVVKDTEGEYITLNGNQTGVLLMEYILSHKKEAGTLPPNAVVIKTIVTTEMAKAIADNYGVEIIDVLTGFKFIGEKIKEFEQESNSKQFIFGFEESYGYLAGTYARDKDAVVGSMLIAEMAAWYKSRGMSLYEGLQELYKKYGFYLENLESITLEGKEGLEKIDKIIKTLRENTPKKIGSFNVTAFRDYKKKKRYDFINGKEESIELPSSEVLYFEIEEDKKFVIRPSGTEPKIKMYFSLSEDTLKAAENTINSLKEDAISMIKEIYQK